MTTGALIFAFNNEKTDYVRMAAWCANRVKQYLDIPVAIVTDANDPDLNRHFDRLIMLLMLLLNLVAQDILMIMQNRYLGTTPVEQMHIH